MKKWKTQVNNKLEEISQNHDNIIIVAHSMGSLLSMQAFSGYKDRIKAMFFSPVAHKIIYQAKADRNSF